MPAFIGPANATLTGALASLPVTIATPVGAPSAAAATASGAVLTGTPYGTAIPLLFGRCQVPGIPLWSGPIIGDPNGSATSSHVSFAVAFGRPSVNSDGAVLKRLWVNGVQIYDSATTTIAQNQSKPGFICLLSTPTADPVDPNSHAYCFYDGSETQLPDPTIAADKGALTPAFRGLIYIVFTNYLLDWSGGTYPNVSADIAQHTTAINYVDKYTPNVSTPSYDVSLMDWRSGLIYFFGADNNAYIYNTLNNTLSATYSIANYRHDFYVTQSYNFGPYIYLSDSHLFGSDPVYMISKQGFAVVDQITIPFVIQCFTGKGLVGTDTILGNVNIDELIVFGRLNSSVMLVKARIGTKFADYFPETPLDATNFFNAGTWAEVPGINVNDVPLTGKSNNLVGSRPVPADTTQFSVFYMAVNGVGIKRFIATVPAGTVADSSYGPSLAPPTGMVAVLNRMEAVFHTLPIFDSNGVATGGTSGAYDRQQYSLYEAQGVIDVASVSATYFFLALFAGPATNPYLSALVKDTSDSSIKLLIYSTPWNANLPNPQALAYDNVVGTSTGTEYTIPTDIDTKYVLLQTVTLPITFSANSIQQTNSVKQRQPGSNVIAFKSADHELTFVNLATGDTSTTTISNAQLRDGTSLGSFDVDIRDIYDPKRQVMYYSAVQAGGLNYPGTYSLNDTVDGSYTLEAYITELCLQGGLASGDIEFTDVSGIVIIGGILNTTVKLVDLLGQICELFRVDIVETGGKIKFIGKTGNDLTYAAELIEDDLAPLSQTSADDGFVIQSVRTATSDLPSVLNLDYLDFDNNCEVGSQSARRTKFPVPVTKTVAVLGISVPVVMTGTLAAFWIQRCLYDLWAGVVTNSIMLGPEHIELEPGDYVKITLDDNPQFYTTKISQVVLNGDCSLSVDAITITQFVSFPAPSDVPSPLSTQPPSQLAIVPTFETLFVDNDRLISNTGLDQIGRPLGVYNYDWVVPSDATLWSTQQIADTTFTTTPLLAGNPISVRNLATIGVLQSTIASVGNALFQTDTTNKLVVQFGLGQPAVPFTDSDAAFWGGQNACLIGNNDKGWELIYYRNVGRTATNQLVLFNLARGRKGTDTLVDIHQPGDFVIFVTPTAAVIVPAQPSDIGQTRQLKTVPLNVNAGDPSNTVSSVTPLATAFKPWAPANLKIVRDSITHDLTITWLRRARAVNPRNHDGFINGFLSDNVNLHDGDAKVPLYEVSENYTLEILTDDGVTVTRSIDLTSPTYTYTSADQTTDSNALTRTTLRARVYQISMGILRHNSNNFTIVPLNITDPGVGKGYPREKLCNIAVT